MEAFYAVLPVFLLIAVGAAVHMTDVLPENTGAAMGLYVLKLALPVLMLHILAGASRLDLAHGGFWLGVIGAQMLCYLLGYAVDRLFSRRGTGPAIISGLALAAVNFLRMILFSSVSTLIAATVSVTLFCTVIIAMIVGCLLPMGAKRIGFDPAVMASPMITTIVDACSLLIYFMIASTILGL